MYDTIIIGGGIAGLYASYKITKQSPKTKILVLEKNEKQHLGGRMGVEKFKGTDILTGAGIGRKKKDTLLVKLLDELKIDYGEFPISPHYAKTIEKPCELKRIFLSLKQKYDPLKDRNKTFKQFATSFLTADEYRQFTRCSGYTDYENEDAHGTLFHYGFDDNYARWTGLGIQWRTLLDKLVEKIGNKNIKCSQDVVKLSRDDSIDRFNVSTKSGSEYMTKRIIFATTIPAVLNILPGANKKDSIYQDIKGQSFIRIYGHFDKPSAEIMKTVVPYTMVVPGPFHKIIPMSAEAGVYMIAYSDNSAADAINKYAENNEKNRNVLCRLVERSVGIAPGSLKLDDIKTYYWQVGTHYYLPLKPKYKNREEFIRIAQHPHPDIMVVGEMVSTNQGWVEGALESVVAVL